MKLIMWANERGLICFIKRTLSPPIICQTIYPFLFFLQTELLEGNKALYKPCSKFEGSFSERRAAFICGGGGGGGGGGDESSVGLAGQFVYVRDDREEADHFGLCEVEVFKAQGEICCCRCYCCWPF